MKPRSFKAFFLAGAEGLGLACRLGRRFCFAEVSTGDPCPSTRGFGEKTEKHTKPSCFNKHETSSHELADDSTTNCQNKLSERSISVTPKAWRQKQEEEGKKQGKPMQKSIEPDMKSGASCCFVSRGSWFLKLKPTKPRHRQSRRRGLIMIESLVDEIKNEVENLFEKFNKIKNEREEIVLAWFCLINVFFCIRYC